MSLRKPLVIVNGQIEQLQTGDTLNATVTGVTIVQKTNDNAGALVIGTPTYVKSNGNVDKAEANAGGTVNLFGLVADVSISAAAVGSIQTDGVLVATTAQWDAVAGTTGGLTPGTTYYLDPATAGKITPTAPTTTGQYVARVGIASASTDLDLAFGPTVLL